MPLAKFVKFREEQFGGVLFETQSEKVYTLNAAAACIVREIREGREVAQIAATLSARFRDPSDAIERDVASLVTELREKGLVA